MTTRLSDIFDLDELERAIEAGLVRRKFHTTAPLAILNYAEKAVFERHWNDVTLACRGLIYNTDTLELVARPMKKFFNFDEMSAQIPHGPCLVAPKMDGSLGVLHHNRYSDEWAIATRGSFVSEQALRGTKIFHEMWDWNSGFMPSVLHTYLFEIVYRENRIVVDYGDLEALVLLEVIDNETGRADLDEFDACDWPVKTERRLIPSFYDTIASDIPAGEEGFVIYWPGADYRVKVKSAEYVELHRLVTGLNERVVWRAFGPDGTGVSLQKFCEPLPDEFHSWVADVVERLSTELLRRLNEVERQFVEITVQLAREGKAERRYFAQLATRSPDAGLLFLRYDGRESALRAKVWDSLRPEGGLNYAKKISEDVA